MTKSSRVWEISVSNKWRVYSFAVEATDVSIAIKKATTEAKKLIEQEIKEEQKAYGSIEKDDLKLMKSQFNISSLRMTPDITSVIK